MLLEKFSTISILKQWLAISLGIVLAVFTLCSPVYQEVSNEVIEQADNQDEIVSEFDFNAIQSGTKVTIERNYYLIETLPKIEEPESEDVKEESFLPSPAKFFKILFEHIISPNSP